MGKISPALMQFQRSAHLYITLVLWTRCQTAREAPQSQNWLCKNSSALIHNLGSAGVCLSPCLFRAATAKTALLNGHFDFVCKGRRPRGRSRLRSLHSRHDYRCSSLFSSVLIFSNSARLGNRRTGQLYPSASSALLLEVPYCSAAFFSSPTLKPNVQW